VRGATTKGGAKNLAVRAKREGALAGRSGEERTLSERGVLPSPRKARKELILKKENSPDGQIVLPRAKGGEAASLSESKRRKKRKFLSYWEKTAALRQSADGNPMAPSKQKGKEKEIDVVAGKR